MSGLRRFARLWAAQFLLLRSGLLLAMTLGAAGLPLAAAWLYRAHVFESRQLLDAFRQYAEQWLPLWALVATSLAWTDGEPPHRPLLLAWPVRPWELALAKVLAAGLAYVLLAAAAAAGLPALYQRVAGGVCSPGALPAGPESLPGGLPGGLLFTRALLPTAVLVALAALGGQFGSPWAGLALGSTLWLLNLPAGDNLWLDRLAGGALNLFAWTRGTTLPLGRVNLHTALLALALHGLVLAVPYLARARLRCARARPGRPRLRG